jgi:hypothetical protein
LERRFGLVAGDAGHGGSPKRAGAQHSQSPMEAEGGAVMGRVDSLYVLLPT